MSQERIRVRISNDTGYSMGTKVELVSGDKVIDLTAFGAVHHPIQMEIKEDGAYAILVLELDSVNISEPIRG